MIQIDPLTSTSAANRAALAKAQPRFTVPAASECVQLITGAWRLLDGGRRLAIHSRQPDQDNDALVATLLTADPAPRVIVSIGLGLGYLLDALERRGWGGTVVALEPEPGTVAPLLERRDWADWIASGRLRLFAAPDFEGASDCWRLFERVAPSEVAVVTNPVIERLRPSAVERARTVLRKIRFDGEANWKARQKHGAAYLLNTLRNLPSIQTEADVDQLTGACPGVPAFVVAAGPSLDAGLPLLRDAQATSLIISVDTALRPLLRAGVTPHLVVAVDPGENNARHLVDLPPCADTWLVAEASLDPLAMRTFAGRTFLFTVSTHEPWPWLQGLGARAGRLRAWGSVLTTAYDLAVRIGSEPVVFVGADLAFTGGRTYCSGTSYEEDWTREAEWGTSREAQWSTARARWPATSETDVTGAPVATAPHLVAFRDWLIDDMRRQTGRRFINATGGGILRGGVIEIANPQDARRWIPRAGRNLRGAIRGRHRRNRPVAAALQSAAEHLRSDAAMDGSASSAILEVWQAFAPGLSRDRILSALDAALGRVPRPPSDRPPRPVAYPEVGVEGHWLALLAPALPLTPLRIPPHRLRVLPNGVRQFRFRSTTARLITSVLRPPDGAVAENGQPLARAIDLDHVTAGTYSICRDEVHFRASDESDPRINGREYTVLVPPPVAYVESLPLDQVLADRL